jgi:hypothetical protein
MMKKIVFLVILSSLLFSCYAQTYDKANPPTNVNVSPAQGMLAGTSWYYIRWVAAENVTGYEIFYQMEGSKIISTLTQQIGFDRTTDTYSCLFDFSSLDFNDKKWRFGIRSSNKIDNGGRISGPSDIVWSGYIARLR